MSIFQHFGPLTIGHIFSIKLLIHNSLAAFYQFYQQRFSEAPVESRFVSVLCNWRGVLYSTLTAPIEVVRKDLQKLQTLQHIRPIFHSEYQ